MEHHRLPPPQVRDNARRWPCCTEGYTHLGPYSGQFPTPHQLRMLPPPPPLVITTLPASPRPSKAVSSSLMKYHTISVIATICFIIAGLYFLDHYILPEKNPLGAEVTMFSMSNFTVAKKSGPAITWYTTLFLSNPNHGIKFLFPEGFQAIIRYHDTNVVDSKIAPPDLPFRGGFMMETSFILPSKKTDPNSSQWMQLFEKDKREKATMSFDVLFLANATLESKYIWPREMNKTHVRINCVNLKLNIRESLIIQNKNLPCKINMM